MLVHRRRPFPRGAFSYGWKAIEQPPQDAKYSWDDDAREDMHNDPRYRGSVTRLYFRGDAAFGNPEMYEYLEAEGIGYPILSI